MNVNFYPRIPPGYVAIVEHTLHVHDGWVVIYTVADSKSSFNEERTCYVQADGHIKWDMINKAQM